MLLVVSNYRNLFEIYNDLVALGFHVGKHYSWAWHNNAWAIDFKDDRLAFYVLLRYNYYESVY